MFELVSLVLSRVIPDFFKKLFSLKIKMWIRFMMHYLKLLIGFQV